jgi:phosphocarrier protein HPr
LNTKQIVKKTFTVLNKKGLHTRPSTELVKCASRFSAKIYLTYQDAVVNAKSLLGILMLAAAKGARITVEAEGHDASEAVETILELAKNHFDMEY